MERIIVHIANGKQCEIRITPTPIGVRVRGYDRGRQIGRSYFVSYETAHQFNETAAHLTGNTAIPQLIECLKSDIHLAAQN